MEVKVLLEVTSTGAARIGESVCGGTDRVELQYSCGGGCTARDLPAAARSRLDLVEEVEGGQRRGLAGLMCVPVHNLCDGIWEFILFKLRGGVSGYQQGGHGRGGC